MDSYRIEWKRSASKELQSLPTDVIRRILTAVDRLSQDPLPHGAAKLAGSEYTYRVRVGDYRVIYTLYQSLLMIEIVRVAQRRDVCR